MKTTCWCLLCLTLLFNPSLADEASTSATVRWTTGIEYANPVADVHLQLNLAQPAGEGPFPAVLCIHGGGFRAGKRDSYDPLCKRLAERGYVAATITYRLAPKHKFPAAIYDTKSAIRWLRANAKKYDIDPNRIGVTGGSAGGHLAQFLAFTADVAEFEGDGDHLDQSSHVSCVVTFYGPCDLTKSYGNSVDAADALPMWLGGNLETARAVHIRASPLNWITPNAPPTLSIHGTEDPYVEHAQSLWLIERLKAANVEGKLLTIQDAGHGFRDADGERAEAALMEFLDRHLKGDLK